MSKNFCSFLIDEGSISEADLVKAFIMQANNNPSLPKIIKDNSILTDDEMLQVYEHQAKNKVSFERSCRDLSIWNQEIEEKLERIIVSNIPSIFKILIEGDLIEMDEIIVKLDEYISNVIENPEQYGLSAAS